MKNMRFARSFHVVAPLVLWTVTLLGSSMALGQQPEYQAHLNWAANDNGHPNCTERYLAVPILASCLVAGNRSCVMGIAIEAAYRNQDAVALYLAAEITQCHNSDARAALYAAGAQQVGSYLRTNYQRPIWGPALDIAVFLTQ